MIWGLLLFPWALWAQLEIEDVTNYSLKDGLSDRAVQDIIQDEEGFLWIATNNGLNRFDGYRFLNFDNNENTEHLIAQSRIHELELLAGGKIGLLNKNERSFFETMDPSSLKAQKVLLKLYVQELSQVLVGVGVLSAERLLAGVDGASTHGNCLQW